MTTKTTEKVEKCYVTPDVLKFHQKLIIDMGDTAVVAALCEIKPPSVSAWKRAGIPKPWLKYFSLLRPELFPKPKASKRAKKLARAA
jgi:hypothetical protein